MTEQQRPTGRWIWHPNAVGAAQTRRTTEGGNLQDAPLYTGGANNFYVMARHVFEVPPATARDEGLTLRCSANDLYEVWLNGKWIGRGPSPSDPSYAYLDRYNLSGLVSTGPNVVVFLCFNQGEGSSHPQFQTLLGPGGLLYQVETAEGRLLAASGDQTKIRKAPHIQQGTDPLKTTVWGYEEVWNLTLAPEGWKTVEFDDSNWEPPAASLFQPAELRDRPNPHLVRWAARPQRIVSVSENDGRIEGAEALLDGGPLRASAGQPLSLPTVILDFGREVVGFPRFEIEGRDGFMVVSYGETLEMERCDTVVPNGRSTWGPYHRRAFRFMGLEFFQFEEVALHSITMECVNAPLDDRGDLKLPDETLEQVWELGRYTLQTATQDYYEADAWRERAVWYCGIEHRLAAVTFGIDGVAKETLRMMARIQDPSGFIPATGPVRNTTILPEVPAYWVRGLYETVLYTGDLDFGRELFSSLSRLLEWYEGQLGESGLLDMTGRPWWVWVDWSRIDRRGEVAVLNFRYLDALADSAALARILGEREAAERWAARADALRVRCRERFREPHTGLYADCFADGERSSWTSQHTNALAVLTGTASPEEALRILDAVLDPSQLPQKPRPFLAINDVWGGWYSSVVDHTGYGEPLGANYPAKIGYAATGFSAGWLAEALFVAGMGERALELIRFHWGQVIERGATAGWELFDPYSQRSAVPHRTTLGARFRNSHCHVYSTLPTYLLSRYLLGVRPLEPGYRTFAVAPQPSGLDWARGHVPTPSTQIGVTWERTGDRLAVDLTVPDGTVALTQDADGKALRFPPGAHSFQVAARQRTVEQ